MSHRQSFKDYIDDCERRGLFCGERLVEESAKLAASKITDLEKENLVALARLVLSDNEHFDGEPTDAAYLSDLMVSHYKRFGLKSVRY